jgi:hypothetical protein
MTVIIIDDECQLDKGKVILVEAVETPRFARG